MAYTPATMEPPPLMYQPCNKTDGLVSVEALRIMVEAKACFVSLALALAYFLTASQHRLWSSSHLIKGFLFAVTQPVTRFLIGMLTMLLAMPFRNDLYLLWGILLLAGYEGVYTISGYGVSARRSDLAIHEFARGYNIVLLGLYVRYYSHASQFRYPLWALWALMVAKFLERIARFKIANGRYGDGNTNLVADYMKHEHELSSNTATEEQGFPMRDCNYLIVGDSKAKSQRTGIYEEKLTPASDTVTVAKVWRCKGELLKSMNGSDKLKDVCLSFALCKLLRRKFAGVAAAESERDKARKLVFDGLLTFGWERTFWVLRAELGFARDLMYTKYPILFSCGFPVGSGVLFAVTLGVTVWILVSAIRHYQIPDGSTSYVVHGKNVDLLITFVVVGMVTAMEICEFFMHLFSDWTKVMIISEYVRKPYLHCCFLNRIMQFVCYGKIAEPIGSSLGQFDLLKGAQKCGLPECIVKLFYNVRSFVLLTNDEEYRINKGKTLRPVPDEVKEMIHETLLKNRERLTQRQCLLRISELQKDTDLSEYCNLGTAIETIMVWHVATCNLEAECPAQKPNKNYEVATELSKYCAYLVFYKPKLLPIGNNSVRYICKTLVEEATQTVGGGAGGGDEATSMIKKGKKLAELLNGGKPRGALWKELAEFWSELVILLAPSGSVSAHEKGLGKGGEFITHLWALLYHAGIDDKFSWSGVGGNGNADGRNGRDNRLSQNGMDTAIPHAANLV